MTETANLYRELDFSNVPPGLYPKMHFDDYLRASAINNSLLKKFADQTPAHARAEMLAAPESKTCFDEGDALHAALLEPGRIERDFAVAPPCDRRTTIGKKIWSDFQNENMFKTILDDGQYKELLQKRNSLMKHELISKLLTGPGENEVGVFWKDEETGLLCKARLDRYTAYAGWPTIVDIKTTKSADRFWFSRDIHKLRYYMQAAWYLRGLNAMHRMDRKFLFACVENYGSFEAVVYELEADALEEGDKKCTECLKTLAHCQKTNQWPGYPGGINLISIPTYAFSQPSLDEQ